MEVASIVIAILALSISGWTAYKTLFQRGTLKMTQPTVFFFGPDGRGEALPTPKVFLRTLLYSTAKRGHVIENMYVELVNDNAQHLFNIWVYGEREKLVRGSGLFVTDQGIPLNHHFLLPITPETGKFEFFEGDYTVRVFATLAGKKKALKLGEFELSLRKEHFFALASHNTGIYFDWMPDSREYRTHADISPVLDPTP